jgi:hypothetical protein
VETTLNNQKNNLSTNLKAVILDAVSEFHPESVNQLLELVQKQTSASAKEITQGILDLEDEDKLSFTEKTQVESAQRKSPMLKKAVWYWTTMALIVTTIAIFSLSTLDFNSLYLVDLRDIVAVTLVLFLPGFTFIKLIYGSKMPFSNSTKTDYIELVGLSIGISTILVPIAGVALNYTPWGITFESTTISLLFACAIFASGGALRDEIN